METIHGGDVYRNPDCIDFSANINPIGPPEEVKQAIRDSLDKINNYPDIYCESLREKLAVFHNVNKEQIICGNGAADIIFRYVLALKPLKALVADPCFAEYEKSLEYIGTEVKHYKINQTTFCIEDDFLEFLTDDMDIVFLCNPNNPTGKLISHSLLLRIAERCKKKNIKLFMDECFMDFLSDENKKSLIRYVCEQSFIFILRAFTKMYAIPGIRLGYGICSDIELIGKMEKAGPPWNVSIPAQAAGVAALEQRKFVEYTKTYIAQERDYIEKNLERLNITYWKGSANFIFLYDKRNLKELLLENKILIRDCGNFVGLSEGFFRIAVKDRASNKKIIEVLESLN